MQINLLPFNNFKPNDNTFPFKWRKCNHQLQFPQSFWHEKVEILKYNKFSSVQRYKSKRNHHLISSGKESIAQWNFYSKTSDWPDKKSVFELIKRR
jgi:hypothetical protein